MCLVSAFIPCPYVEIRDNRTGLGSPILPCPYAEIRNNRTGLCSAIPPCLYVEIRDSHTGLGSAILHVQCLAISVYHMVWAQPSFVVHM